MQRIVGRLFRNLALRTCDREEIDGLWIASSGEWLSKIRDALGLIKTQDPRRYSRITKDLEGIWARVLNGSDGQFDYSNYVCELDERFVDSATPNQIAFVIVHEAAHARLWRRGFRYDEGIRQRVEAICVRQEQAFASRLPELDKNLDELAQLLELPESYWSDQSFYRRHIHGSVAAARYLQVPRWLIGFALWRLRSRRRRQRYEAKLAPRTAEKRSSGQ